MTARTDQAQITAWLPDHLRVLRETVDVAVRPCPAASGLVLLIQAYLLCAEMLAHQLVSVMPIGERPAP